MAELTPKVLPQEPTHIAQKSQISDGGRGRNRTFNLSIKSRMLCQLSYASTEGRPGGKAPRRAEIRRTLLNIAQQNHRHASAHECCGAADFQGILRRNFTSEGEGQHAFHTARSLC